MPLDVITPDAVREALRALRYANELRGSPLLHLDIVSLRLRADDLADTRQGRAWALGRCLEDVVDEQLRRLRGAPTGASAGAASTSTAARHMPDDELAQLWQDLQSGSADRLDWALLHWRYLSPTRQPVRAVERALGVAARTVQNRVARGVAALTDVLWQSEVEATRQLETTTGVRSTDRVMVDEAAQPRDVVELMGELRALIGQHRASVRISPAQLEAVARYPAAELIAYRLGRIAEWSLPRYRLDSRFVDLSLLVDMGEEAQSGRWQAREEHFADLRDVLAMVAEPAVVLLGPPGSGKSTLLRRLELDLSRDALGPGDTDAAAPLTFFVSLNQYRSAASDAALPSPKDWLAERWAARYPQLPPLTDLAAERGIVFLLDGLNEMPHRTAADYRERIGLWRQFLLETVTPGSGHRAVIACRSLDYSAPLSTPALRVPQVQVEPLTDHEVEAFLRRYSPGHGHELWAQLRGTNVLGALRWPFFLRLVVESAEDTGRWEGGVAALFTAAVRRALVREIERHNPLLEPNGLLDGRDYARIVGGRGWRTPYELPERGALIRRLAELAYVIQVAAIDGASSQVRVGYAEALALLGSEGGTAGDGAAGRCAAEVIGVGAALGLLDEDRAADEVMFRHQLVQEYFAARRLAREPNAERVRREWRAEAVTPCLDDVLDGLDPADELPPLPSTGWEETTLLAAAMADAPEVIVRGVMATNLALAGRAAALPEVRGRLGDAVIDDVRWALVRRSRDPAADLRERIDCGHTVGELGDPRFERRVGAYGTYAWPPFVAVDGGLYPIGEDEAIERPAGGTAANREAHEPRHLVDVCAFQIGQFPVTNAEWSLFMAAGGYDDERWWETDDGRRWRRGALANEGSKGNDRRWRARFLDDPRLFGVMEAQNRFPSLEALERWRGWLQLDDAAFEAALDDRWAMRRATEPAFWADVRLNKPTQPVVGICWYEARAYCAWISAQSGRAVRLPTEVEWEAAARGGDGRRYPWGEAFHRLNANTLATRVQRSTPVGVFPSGDSPAGVSDASGNTYEWTASLWGERDDAPTFGYPYDPNDGREATTAGPTLLRVVRGGSGGLEHVDARPAYRNRYHPTYRYYGVGFRLAISSAPTAPSPPPNTRTSRCRCGSVAAPVPPRRPTS